MNLFEAYWETSIEMKMHIMEAQFLCWASGDSAAKEKFELEYRTWKNYVDYAKGLRSVFFVGPWAEAVYLLGFPDDWFKYTEYAGLMEPGSFYSWFG